MESFISIFNTKNKQYFESQEADESVVFVIRKHWSYLSVPFFAGTILAVAIFIFYYSLKSNDPLSFSDQPVYESLFALLLLLDITYVLNSWLMRYFNIVILTNKHLVEVEQHALFSRRVSVLGLFHIEDAASQQSGLLATLLDFGSVEIQTAGEMRNFIFNNFGNPDDIQKKIMTQKQAALLASRPAHQATEALK